MKQEIDDLKNAEQKIAAVREAFEALSEQIETLADAIEGCETIDFISESAKKLTKKQRKEKAKELLKKKFPKLFSYLQEIKELVESVSFEIEDISGEAETAIENISQAEGLIAEAREKLEGF
jgi:chromosome segregation ATPase